MLMLGLVALSGSGTGSTTGFGSPSPSPSPPGVFDCLPEPLQGMAAVRWNDSVLLVGGSSSPGAMRPPYTEHATIWRGSRRAASGRWSWGNFSSLRQGLTHAAAVAVGDTLYMMGGYGPGPCKNSPSPGKCAHSAVWAIDLRRPELPAVQRAPMGWNRSNFGAVAFGGKVYTAGGYGNFGVARGGGGGSGGGWVGAPRLGGGGPPAECVQGNTDVYDPWPTRGRPCAPCPRRAAGWRSPPS